MDTMKKQKMHKSENNTCKLLKVSVKIIIVVSLQDL